MFAVRRLLLLWFCAASAALAHQVDSVEFEFLESGGTWVLEGEMDIAYMLPETRREPGGQPLSRKAVMECGVEELERIRRETERTLRRIMVLEFDGREVGWRVEFPDFKKLPFSLPREDMDWALLTVRVVADEEPGSGRLLAQWLDDEGAELIVMVEGNAGRLMTALPGHAVELLRKGGAAGAEELPPPGESGSRWIGNPLVIIGAVAMVGAVLLVALIRAMRAMR